MKAAIVWRVCRRSCSQVRHFPSQEKRVPQKYKYGSELQNSEEQPRLMAFEGIER
jgi:hypothetical protein